MIALYDYDPMELSPNVDMEVGLDIYNCIYNLTIYNCIYNLTIYPRSGGAQLPDWRHHHRVRRDGR